MGVDIIKSALDILTVADGQELILDVLEDVFLEFHVDFLEETSQLRSDLLLHFLVHPFGLRFEFLLENQTCLLYFGVVFFFILADAFLEVGYLSLESVDQLSVVLLG